ncbi:hypothetical protein OG331_49245 [Streptomyces sp. NBC_01017]|uniref:hypothetical protein n=1 Tax=Streptomyces sp. NBC_01017 TaxID=2903721 RepID=UPI003867A99B|nr:hypothetical protein OG331_02730 [Streptomyces sp. NBC_01017]WSV34994.1 hypothetical protein OG331_49245 [Streptomyces sp. NBC_01017]
MARVLAILPADPERQWRSREIAALLDDITFVAAYRQLARRRERNRPHGPLHSQHPDGETMA